MKSIEKIRPLIAQIPGTMMEFDPEEVYRGYQGGIRTLWYPNGSSLRYENDILRGDFEEIENEALDISPKPVEEIFEHGSDVDEENMVDAFDGEEGEKIRKSILVLGVDALAWYVSFHVKGAQWGIYIPIGNIIYLVLKIFNRLDTDFSTKFRIAFRALHQHELFHFAVDYMSAQWEAVTGKPCYHPGKKAFKDPLLQYNVLEEQAANANMIRSFWGGRTSLKIRNKTKFLRNFVKEQPPGYRDGGKITSRSSFFEHIELLSEKYIRNIPEYNTLYLDAVDINLLYPIFPTIDWRYCPIHIIHNEDILNIPLIDLELFRNIPRIIESQAFKKHLEKLSVNIQKAWEKVKNILTKTTTLKGLDFKLWERGGTRIFSVRVSKGYRAHLEYSNTEQIWTALSIGTHKEMGHG